MLRAVTHELAQSQRAYLTFHTVAAKLEHDRVAIDTMPAPPTERLANYRAQARAAIQDLLPVAAMPDYHACLRVLHEVRLALSDPDVALPDLRRNLDLFLDGHPDT